MSKTSATSLTPNQEKAILDFVRDELYALGTDKDSAQRIILKAGDLKTTVRETFITLGSMRYRSEEVASKYGYTLAVKPICEQLLALMKYFPGLDPGPALTCSKSLGELPEGAEGWFVIPKPEKVAKTYGEALETALTHLAAQRGGKFTNWRDGKLGPKYLRLTEKTQKALEALSATQSGDFLIIPAQFGIRHRGRSVRRAREVFVAKEFGLGPFETAIMLLTHPKRLARYENLFIDCPGAEYDYSAFGSFDRAPYFDFCGGRLRFGTDLVSDYYDYYGAASAFLP